jgi:microcystin-dependent protein
MRALPGVAQNLSQGTKPSTQGLRLVPDVADAIPANVLAHPFIGEARRFDGATAPGGWSFAQGQTLNVAANRPLFSICGTMAGGDGKTTFKLPAAKFGLIVAVAGTYPNGPAVLTQSGRHMTVADSLGPNAQPRPPSMAKPVPQQVLAARRLLSAQVRVGAPNPTRMRPELAARAERARSDAHGAATTQMSAGSRATLESAAQRYLSGQIALYDAVRTLSAALTNQETEALLQIQSDMTQQFTSAPVARPADPRGEASRFLFIVTITEEQIAAAASRGVELR